MHFDLFSEFQLLKPSDGFDLGYCSKCLFIDEDPYRFIDKKIGIGGFKKHVRGKHEKAGPFPCDYCKVEFQRRYQFNDHLCERAKRSEEYFTPYKVGYLKRIF